MSGNSNHTRSSHKGWWAGWLLATIVIPGSTLRLLSATPADQNAGLAIALLCLAGGMAFYLHIVSSIKLGSNLSSVMTALLVFGGWLLMAMSFFAGCLAANHVAR